MLVGQVLMCLLYRSDNLQLDASCSQLVIERVPHVLMQVLNRTLQTQNPDGSWGSHLCEVTAYAVLTLKSSASAPWIDFLQHEVNWAIQRGQDFLRSNKDPWQEPDHIWVEKVTYASPILSKAYFLAALKAEIIPHSWSNSVREVASVSPKSLSELPAFFSKLPLFSKQDNTKSKLKSALVQSRLFLRHLRDIKLDIFPRSGMTEDKYLEYIPFIWVACNNLLSSTPVNIDTLREMLIISMLNYQADEYMEVIGRKFPNDMYQVKAIILEVCGTPTQEVGSGDDRQPTNGIINQNGIEINPIPEAENDLGSVGSSGRQIRYAEVKTVLSKFVGYVLGHADNMSFHITERAQLRHELALFLLAHLQQSKDNSILSSQHRDHNQPVSPLIFESPATSYYNWVRGVSETHTSCPYSFVFYNALVASSISQNDNSVRRLPELISSSRPLYPWGDQLNQKRLYLPLVFFAALVQVISLEQA